MSTDHSGYSNKPAEMDFLITESGAISAAVRQQGFDHFQSLAEYVSGLPYGRPEAIDDALAVLTERKGTCSFKHRLLALVAEECGRADIQLVVGLYEMSEQNTPGVGRILEQASLRWIPEAHCYLRLGQQRYDFTGLNAGDSSPFDALLAEYQVTPAGLFTEKNRLHKEAIQTWAQSHAVTPEKAWALREACIRALALKSQNGLAACSGSP